jgi:hypothetical protein
MSTTKTRIQKPKSYEERIAKSRDVLKNLRKKANRAINDIENTTK